MALQRCGNRTRFNHYRFAFFTAQAKKRTVNPIMNPNHVISVMSLCINMNQIYSAFSFRTMTFVMFPIYFTFIFAFLLPLCALSQHTNTDPALLYTLLLSSSQSGGWVSQIRLCQVEAVVMKSGVTSVCYSFS